MPQASTCAAVGLLGLLFTPCHAVSEYGEYRLSPFGWSHQGEWWLRNSAKLVRPGPTRLPALPLRRETTDCIHHVPSNTVVKETRLGTLELTFPNGTVASHAACPHARHASHLSIGQALCLRLYQAPLHRLNVSSVLLTRIISLLFAVVWALDFF